MPCWLRIRYATSVNKAQPITARLVAHLLRLEKRREEKRLSLMSREKGELANSVNSELSSGGNSELFRAGNSELTRRGQSTGRGVPWRWAFGRSSQNAITGRRAIGLARVSDRVRCAQHALRHCERRGLWGVARTATNRRRYAGRVLACEASRRPAHTRASRRPA